MTSNVAIIGAGPAGLSCALWLTNQGYHPVVLERASHPCGMLRFNHHSNDWLLGFTGETGISIGNKFLAHIRHKKINIITSALLTSINQQNGGFAISFTDQLQKNQIEVPYLVIASGTRQRAPVEFIKLASQFPENFFIGAGELCVNNFTAGQYVAILGGGDNALENAYHLAQLGVNVDIYSRSETRSRHEWLARCSESSKITVHTHTIISQITFSAKRINFLANSEPRQADAVAVMYGYEPNTDILREISPWLDAVIDEKGFIKVNAYQQTHIDHLYAIGDVTDRPFPCLPSAIGQGSIAAKAIVLDAEGIL